MSSVDDQFRAALSVSRFEVVPGKIESREQTDQNSGHFKKTPATQRSVHPAGRQSEIYRGKLSSLNSKNGNEETGKVSYVLSVIAE